jgi:hypothetical protein
MNTNTHNSNEDQSLIYLQSIGFKGKVSPQQAHLMLQPSSSPETYFLSGALTKEEALNTWITSMAKAGILLGYIEYAVNLHFRR